MMTMPDDKQVIDDLADKVLDCADLARAQRAGADAQQAGAQKQHEEARKLEKMGAALKQDVADLRRQIDPSASKS